LAWRPKDSETEYAVCLANLVLSKKKEMLPVWEALIADVAPSVDALQYLRHPFRQRPYLISVYLTFVESQLGFRAPPFC
jgi:hypothetical protein